jgi:hypothetical protein
MLFGPDELKNLSVADTHVDMYCFFVLFFTLNRYCWTVVPLIFLSEQDSKKAQLEQDSQNRTVRTGQPEHQNRTARKGQSEQYS